MKTVNKNILYIPKGKLSSGRKIAYSNPVFDYRSRKYDPYRIILPIGGYKLTYPSDSGYPAEILLEAKIPFGGVISTPGSQFIYADIKDYFIRSPMEHFEYIKFLSSRFLNKYALSITYTIF